MSQHWEELIFCKEKKGNVEKLWAQEQEKILEDYVASLRQLCLQMGANYVHVHLGGTAQNMPNPNDDPQDYSQRNQDVRRAIRASWPPQDN